VFPKKRKKLETFYPIPGYPQTRVEVYDGCAVVFLHYTADPEKRTKEWYNAERAEFFAAGGTEEGWQQEYEINFDVSGNPKLFPMYDPDIHEKEIEYDPFLPIIRGWDFGYSKPATAFIQKNKEDQIVVLDALLGDDMGIEEWASHILTYCEENFKPGTSNGRKHPIRYEDYCDHAGTQQHNMGNTVKILRREFRIRPRSRYSKPEERVKLMRHRMAVRNDGKPGMIVNANSALIREGFRGGFSSKPDAMGDGTSIPYDKTDYVHVLDAIGYPIEYKFGVRKIESSEEEKRRLRRHRRMAQAQYGSVTGYSPACA